MHECPGSERSFKNIQCHGISSNRSRIPLCPTFFKERNFSADFQDVEKFVTSRPPRESGDSGAITRKQIYSQGANEFSANQLHPEQAAGIKTAVTASVLESKFARKR